MPVNSCAYVWRYRPLTPLLTYCTFVTTSTTVSSLPALPAHVRPTLTPFSILILLLWCVFRGTVATTGISALSPTSRKYEINSTYIESVDPRIRPFLREALEDRFKISLIDLCRKEVNQVELLQRRASDRREMPQGRAVICRHANLFEEELIRQVNIIHPGEHKKPGMGLESDNRSDLPTGSTQAVATPTQTAEDVRTIEAEALILMNRRGTRSIPLVSKGTYPFIKPGCRLVGRGAPRVQKHSRTQRPMICWRCYAKGHKSPNCSLDYDTRSDEVILNYESLTFE